MAITFDNNKVRTVNPASNTVSYTTAGSDRFLCVGTLKQSSQTITAVTYNGVSMTKELSGNWYRSIEEDALWSLMNPSTGANNAVMTESGGGTDAITLSSYNGVAQTGQPEASSQHTVTGTTTTVTTSVTTVTDNSWLVGHARTGSNPMSAGSNTVLRGTASNINNIDTNADQTPTGSYSMTVTQASTANNMGLGIMAIAPSGGSTPTTYNALAMSNF